MAGHKPEDTFFTAFWYIAKQSLRISRGDLKLILLPFSLSASTSRLRERVVSFNHGSDVGLWP